MTDSHAAGALGRCGYASSDAAEACDFQTFRRQVMQNTPQTGDVGVTMTIRQDHEALEPKRGHAPAGILPYIASFYYLRSRETGTLTRQRPSS